MLLTFIETTTIIRLQRVTTLCDGGGNGAGGEVGFFAEAPYASRNRSYAQNLTWLDTRQLTEMVHPDNVTQTCSV